MRRAFLFFLLAFFLPLASSAQKVPGGLLGKADALVTDSSLGRAGRRHLEVQPPQKTTFSPRPFDPGAPSFSISGDFDFVNYLLDSEMVTDALVLLSEKNYAPSDTLSWLRALALMDSRQFSGAADYFTLTSGVFSEPSLFFEAYTSIQAGDIVRARTVLGNYSGDKTELAALQKAGASLIGGDFAAYREASASFKYQDYRLSESEAALEKLYRSISTRHKSPLTAAALSAVIPGAGRVYSGEIGAGVASFLTVAPLAAITAEQWTRNGPGYWGTILSGAVFSLFYIANIYGSYFSVSIQEQAFKNDTKAVVMYNLHIPLRSFFR